MTKRVFIVHGWDGYPEEGIFPWLKKELENKGFEVFNPFMPEPQNPTIDKWVSFLALQIGIPDENTILFRHSIGAQTILRYLETLDVNKKIGGAVFLAGWVNLTEEAYEDEGDKEIAKPWLEIPIDWEKVKARCVKFIGIWSDDDPLVPLSDSQIFQEKLGAEIIVEHKKGHFSGSDRVTEFPSALEAIKSF